MIPNPETISGQRYIALDLHKHSIMVGGQNRDQTWILKSRKVPMPRFRQWAEQNLKSGDAVIIETTGNTWDIYDIVAPRVTRTAVAHAGKVRQIAEARVKTDTEDLRRFLTVLVGNIVPSFFVLILDNCIYRWAVFLGYDYPLTGQAR